MQRECKNLEFRRELNKVGKQFGWAQDARLHVFSSKILLYSMVPSSENIEHEFMKNISYFLS
jgi:hypothetical protein